MNELISAAVGVVVGVILNDPLVAIKNYFIRHTKRFFLKRKKNRIVTGLFQFGKLQSSWMIIDGDGNSKYTPKTIFTYFDNERVTLPRQLQNMISIFAKNQEVNRKKGLPFFFNGETYQLEKFSVNRFSTDENLELHLRFRPSDYYTFQSTDMNLQNTEFRKKYFGEDNWIQPKENFSHSFGINLLVITKDDHIILTKRSGLVGTNQHLYHISVNEGLSRTFDRGVNTQAPDVYRAGIRGLIEELGVQNVESSNITYLSFGVDTKYSQWGLLGKAKVDKTSDEILSWRGSGVKDKWETEDFFVIPLDLEKIVNFVSEHRDWTPAGITCLYHTLVSEFGRNAVERKIQKHFR